MHSAASALGSNIGDKFVNVEAAMSLAQQSGPRCQSHLRYRTLVRPDRVLALQDRRQQRWASQQPERHRTIRTLVHARVTSTQCIIVRFRPRFGAEYQFQRPPRTRNHRMMEELDQRLCVGATAAFWFDCGRSVPLIDRGIASVHEVVCEPRHVGSARTACLPTDVRLSEVRPRRL